MNIKELKNLEITWKVGYPTRVSFILELEEGYEIHANDLLGDVIIHETKKKEIEK